MPQMDTARCRRNQRRHGDPDDDPWLADGLEDGAGSGAVPGPIHTAMADLARREQIAMATFGNRPT